MEDYHYLIVKSITKVYEEKLFSLRSNYQGHWSIRMWRIKGGKKYLPSTFTEFQFKTLRILPKIAQVNLFKSAKSMGRKELVNYKPTKPKRLLRLPLYEKNPELLVYIPLVHYLFLTKSFRLHQLPALKVFFDKGIRLLSGRGIEKLFLSNQFILTNPSVSANSIYYFKFLKISDYEKELIDSYKKIWLEKEPADVIEWQNKIYGFTHLIIAASYFYQRKVDKTLFEWALSYFESNIDKIIENTNPDIVAEVGLCFRLCDIETSPVLARARQYISSRFDNTKGYIPREKDDSLERAEHRNIVAILLLAKKLGFNKGPDLSSYLTDSKNSLVLPQEIKVIGSSDQEEL
ncbi:DUF3541 domain-containing protein [Candidatus Woesebacteria bacterium]|nr:DUF3541 domain-containing protein [Candidatus Woesebacteria bacterium]